MYTQFYWVLSYYNAWDQQCGRRFATRDEAVDYAVSIGARRPDIFKVCK